MGVGYKKGIREMVRAGCNIRVVVEEDELNCNKKVEDIGKEIVGMDRGVLYITPLREELEREELGKYYEREGDRKGSVYGGVLDIIKSAKNFIVIVEEKDQEIIKDLYKNNVQFVLIQKDYNIYTI